MTTTITDAFDLPRPEDIRAMGFVVKLRDSDPGSDEVKQLVDDYVITPAVAKELPRILDDMKQVFDRGEEYGRFIHGSFGSGKSHFMTMLSLLLEGTQPRGRSSARSSTRTRIRRRAGGATRWTTRPGWRQPACSSCASTCCPFAARLPGSTARCTKASMPH
jgi:hypothetical protein